MKKEDVVSRSPNVLNGALVFTGTRVPVEVLVQHLAAGDPQSLTSNPTRDVFPAWQPVQ